MGVKATSGAVEQGLSTAREGSLPLKQSDRNWGPLAVFGNSASTAVATWCFIIGGYISFYVPAGVGTVVIIAGMLIGMFFILMATLPMSTRYGLEAVRSTRPTLGVRGTGLTLALLFVFTTGWNALLLIFLGRAAAQILISLGLLGESLRAPAEIISSLIGCAVVWGLLRGGPERLKKVGPVIAASVIVLAVVILILLVTQIGFDGIFNAVAVAPYEDQYLNYVVALELMIATALSWWPYVGSMIRLSGNTRRTIMPTILGLGLAVSAVCLIGLYAGIAFPESGGDPTQFLTELGGPIFSIIALAFIVLANVGTAMIGVYAAGLALKQVPAIDKKVPWNGATAIATIPVALVVVFIAGPFFDNFGTFLAFSGVLFGPICGIQIADYFFVRKQRLDAEGLFAEGRKSSYWYWNGFNPIGFLSLIAGCGFYLLILDPVTFESQPLFVLTTASVPAIIVAGAVYYIATKIWQATRKQAKVSASTTSRTS